MGRGEGRSRSVVARAGDGQRQAGHPPGNRRGVGFTFETPLAGANQCADNSAVNRAGINAAGQDHHGLQADQHGADEGEQLPPIPPISAPPLARRIICRTSFVIAEHLRHE